MQTLTDDQVADALLALPGWTGNATAIFREFHIDIRWVTVRFSLSSHDAGGVTSSDLALARQIDEVAAQLAIAS